MSEPPRWGPPPGFDVASAPTTPIPTTPGQRPGQHPGQHPGQPPRPPAPRPTAPHPTRQAPPVDPDDHDGAYRDDYGADRDDRRIPRAPAQPRSRGQVLAGLVLVLALVVSGLMGVLTYQLLASADIISPDPLAGLGSQAATLGGVAVGALVVFLLAVIAVAVARPKALAAIGLAASLLLPVGALALGVWYGGAVLRQNVESDVAAEGAAAAQTVAAAVDELERSGLNIGPLRDIIIGFAGQGG